MWPPGRGLPPRRGHPRGCPGGPRLQVPRRELEAQVDPGRRGLPERTGGAGLREAEEDLWLGVKKELLSPADRGFGELCARLAGWVDAWGGRGALGNEGSDVSRPGQSVLSPLAGAAFAFREPPRGTTRARTALDAHRPRLAASPSPQTSLEGHKAKKEKREKGGQCGLGESA